MVNSIVHGDCLEVMQRIPDGSVDMILADLPYGVTKSKWDSIIPFEPLWKQYNRVIKTNGAILLTASQPFTTALISSNPDMFRYCWYWIKERGTGIGFSKRQPLRRVEEVCVFYKQQPLYDSVGEELDKPYRHALPIVKSTSGSIDSNNLTEDGERVYRTYTHATKHNVLEFSRDNAARGLHPTQKPVALFEYLIRTYTNPGDVVLDNTIGSGTTAVAAINTGRNFIGIEQEEEYVLIARDRVRVASEQVSLFKEEE